jgi:two-component sensor histidine kinase
VTNITSIDLLCSLHTNLAEEDILKIYEVADHLPLMADLNRANIFIDCLTKEGKHGIVVAEAAPETEKSVYKKPVAGKFVYEAFEPAVFFALRTGNPMFLNRALTQEGKTVEQSVVPLKGMNNRVIAALIMEKDISETIQHQEKMEAFSKTTETLSEILMGMTEHRSIIPEFIEEALFFIDFQSDILYFNPAAINLVSEVCGEECKVNTPIDQYFPYLKEILQDSDELLIREMEILNKVFRVKKISLGQHEKANGTFVIFKDITELREKERALVVKSVMIREIHHRVKNNLQTVASLLRLQMRRGVSEESKVHFVESLNRILSIASVYEIILSNSSVDDVDISSLIEKIGNMLVHTDDPEGTHITIEYEGPRFFIQSNKAVSVALVINELIQNSVKHAFKGLKEGHIHVCFQKNEYQMEVRVEDNGVGYSENAKSSLGLEIVKMMIEHDLGGHFTIKRRDKGTAAFVKFPLDGGKTG